MTGPRIGQRILVMRRRPRRGIARYCYSVDAALLWATFRLADVRVEAFAKARHDHTRRPRQWHNDRFWIAERGRPGHRRIRKARV